MCCVLPRAYTCVGLCHLSWFPHAVDSLRFPFHLRCSSVSADFFLIIILDLFYTLSSRWPQSWLLPGWYRKGWGNHRYFRHPSYFVSMSRFRIHSFLDSMWQLVVPSFGVFDASTLSSLYLPWCCDIVIFYFLPPFCWRVVIDSDFPMVFNSCSTRMPPDFSHCHGRLIAYDQFCVVAAIPLQLLWFMSLMRDF